MPLHKRKAFFLVDPPNDLDPDELVYQVRFTKEIFRDYQEYLNHLNLYRQRLWTCKVTGKTNLTYEEALVSEHNATQRLQQFPDELIPHILNMIQFSTLNLTELINEIHGNLQIKLYEGIELHAKKGDSICACKVQEVLDDGEISRCRVGWIDKERQVSDMSVISAEDLIRKRPPFSRSILKAFIRESTSQTAPWVVHEKLAKKHGILTELPRELTDKLSGQNGTLDCNGYGKKDNQKFGRNQKRSRTENGHLLGSQIEEPIKYPIDDLLVKPSADDPVFTDRPSPSTDFWIPMDCVGDLLMVWNFCTSFGRLLHLWPFPLQDFENALCHKDSELILILECHSAILQLLIKDEGDYFMAIRNKKQNSKVKLTNWAEYLCHFLEMRDRPGLSDHIAIIKRGHYGLLDIHVKLGILRELVTEALLTNAIRVRLDECIEQQQIIAARKREEIKTKKEENAENVLKKDEVDSKEVHEEHAVANGLVVYYRRSALNSLPKYNDGNPDANGQVHSTFKKAIRKHGNTIDIKMPKGLKKSTDTENREKKSSGEQRKHLEGEIEKLSNRTNCLGKDRNYNRYWFFRREGRLFVESWDSNKWGYYSTKEELDALIGSLNEKGERERELKRQLNKYYVKISNALQRRSKDIAQKVLVQETELRRSMRVRAQPRCSPAMAFLRYSNKWKEWSKTSKPRRLNL